MVIQPIRKPITCPQCGAVNPPINEGVIFICRACGYDESTAKKSPKPTKREFEPSYAITHAGPIDRWARSIYNTAQDYIRKQDYPAALNSFERALESQPDFIDAHLWIARLSDDEEVKRKHLGYIIAIMPSHNEAIQELMILNGDLTIEESSRITSFAEVERKQAGSAIEADITATTCPQCGGKLTTNAETGAVFCDFCGHVEKMPQTQSGPSSLTVALIKQRAQPVQWSVGERLVHCDNCGAERTLKGDKLSSHCLFCGSTQVVLKDTLDSFRQPDAVLRFAINRQKAEELLYKQLEGRIERLKGLFVNNKVKRTAFNGLYLPFWVFDSVLDITRTMKENTTMQYNPRGSGMRRESFTDMYNNLAVPAVESPPEKLLRNLSNYDFSRLVPYRPELLSRFSAELYTMDFDRASLKARGIIGETMRNVHKIPSESGESVGSVSVSVRQMSFQLVLLPVWIVNILEDDDDIRLGLINGQTGKVVLGKALKPDA